MFYVCLSMKALITIGLAIGNAQTFIVYTHSCPK